MGTIFSSCQTTAYQTLKRVFEEQYTITQDKDVLAKDKEEITSNIQMQKAGIED